jgi:hypothetical protein
MARTDRHEIVRVRVWEWAQQNRVERAEDRHGHTNAHCNAEYGSEREARIPPEGAQRYAELLEKPVQPRPEPRLPGRLSYETLITKLSSCESDGLFVGIALRETIRDCKAEMLLDFIVEVPFSTASSKPRRSHPSPARIGALRIPAIAADSSSQRVRSTTSCRRPSAVSR